MVSPLALLWLQVMPGPSFIDVGPKRDVWPVNRSLAPYRPTACSELDRSATLRRHIPAIRALYQRNLKDAPGLAGRVVLRLKVDARGQVTEASGEASGDADAELARGMAAEAQRWRFEPCDQGWEMSIPFTFTPG